MRRRTEITIETERVIVVSRPREGCVRWCARCGAESRVVALEDASTLLRASGDSVLSWAGEAGHHVVNDGGSLFLCLRSRKEEEMSDE